MHIDATSFELGFVYLHSCTVHPLALFLFVFLLHFVSCPLHLLFLFSDLASLSLSLSILTLHQLTKVVFHLRQRSGRGKVILECRVQNYLTKKRKSIIVQIWAVDHVKINFSVSRSKGGQDRAAQRGGEREGGGLLT